MKQISFRFKSFWPPVAGATAVAPWRVVAAPIIIRTNKDDTDDAGHPLGQWMPSNSYTGNYNNNEKLNGSNTTQKGQQGAFFARQSSATYGPKSTLNFKRLSAVTKAKNKIDISI